MEIKFKNENGTIFGTTTILAIGERKPNLVYGTQAKKLREEHNLTTEELAKEFKVKESTIEKIEKHESGMQENLMKQYCDKFGVEKEYFFDTELETVIIGDKGVGLKNFKTNKECQEYFNDLMKIFMRHCENNDGTMLVDFSVEAKGE